VLTLKDIALGIDKDGLAQAVFGDVFGKTLEMGLVDVSVQFDERELRVVIGLDYGVYFGHDVLCCLMNCICGLFHSVAYSPALIPSAGLEAPPSLPSSTPVFLKVNALVQVGHIDDGTLGAFALGTIEGAFEVVVAPHGAHDNDIAHAVDGYAVAARVVTTGTSTQPCT
jgi:hypothetical protein